MKTYTFYGDCLYLVRLTESTSCFCSRRGEEVTNCKHCKMFKPVLGGTVDLCALCDLAAPVPVGKEHLGLYVCRHNVYPNKSRPHYTKGLKNCRLFSKTG